MTLNDIVLAVDPFLGQPLLEKLLLVVDEN